MSTHRLSAVIAIALTAGLLAGCAGGSSYDSETAERLQQQVLVVSTASADGDWAGASTALLELEASAATALARGEITQKRFDAIMAALSLVRADIEAAVAEQAAAEEAARQAEEAARQAAEEAAERNEDSGKDRGNGYGKPEKDD